jgi:hypothetical protein
MNFQSREGGNFRGFTAIIFLKPFLNPINFVFLSILATYAVNYAIIATTIFGIILHLG